MTEENKNVLFVMAGLVLVLITIALATMNHYNSHDRAMVACVQATHDPDACARSIK